VRQHVNCFPVAQQLCPPEIKDTPEAPRQASEKLEQMGPMTRDEKIMLGTMGFALALWVSCAQWSSGRHL
jgi:divalent anion:Na+ symporter, DASS family